MKRRLERLPDAEAVEFYVGLGSLTPTLELNLSKDERRRGHALRFHPRDVLVSRVRPNLRRVWVADRPGACNPDIMVLRPTELESLYLAHALRSRPVSAAAHHLTSGQTIPRISYDDFASIAIPVPPSTADRDACVRALEAVREQLVGLRRTRDRRESLGEAIQSAAITRWGEEGRTVRVQLGELLAIETAHSVPTNDGPAGPGEVGVLLADAVASGLFDATRNRSLADFGAMPENRRVRAGDVLMTRFTGPAARPACVLVYDEPERPLVIADPIWRLRPTEGVSPAFVHAIVTRTVAETGDREQRRRLAPKDLLSLSVNAPRSSDDRRAFGNAYGAALELDRLFQLRETALDRLLDALGVQLFAAEATRRVDRSASATGISLHLSERQRAVHRETRRRGDAFAADAVVQEVRKADESLWPAEIRRTLDLLVVMGELVKQAGGIEEWRVPTSGDLAGEDS